MVKVLHIMSCVDIGGISSVVLNYYKNLDRTKVQFDIAITSEVIGINGGKFTELGANIFKIPLKSKDLFGYIRAIKKLLSENFYNAIHVHENETSYVALAVAKKVGVLCRIAHSHSSCPTRNIISELRRLSGCILNTYYATKIIGCGRFAGERIFGKYNMKKKKALILPNAIESERFKFNDAVRYNVRKSLNIEDRYVVGMVGRIDPSKNNIYAIEIFKEIYKLIPNAFLIIAGTGPDEEKLRIAIDSSGIQKNIMYLGRCDEVERLYQAFDIFLMPSRNEGFPVAAVEALASGLPVLLSTNITNELNFGSEVNYLLLEDKFIWATTAQKYLNDPERYLRCSEIRKNGLEISDTAKILEMVYLKY